MFQVYIQYMYIYFVYICICVIFIYTKYYITYISKILLSNSVHRRAAAEAQEKKSRHMLYVYIDDYFSYTYNFYIILLLNMMPKNLKTFQNAFRESSSYISIMRT